MRVKVTFEYEKEVDLPEDEFYKLDRHAIWIADVLMALEHISYLPHWKVERVEEEKDEKEAKDEKFYGF